MNSPRSPRRLLLINPCITDVAAYDLWAWPLGLLHWAARLRRTGYDVYLIDCTDRAHPALPVIRPSARPFHTGKYHAEKYDFQPAPTVRANRVFRRHGLPPAAFENELRRYETMAGGPPDAVLVTSRMTYWYHGVADAIHACKRQWPGVPTALGGIYATLCGAHARVFSGADNVLAGHASETLPRWLHDTLPNGPKIENSPDIFSTPLPFDLCHAHGALPLLSSIGCPCRCSYCASHLISGPYRARSSDALHAELRELHARYGTSDFAFYDDALLVDAERHLEPFLDRVISEGPRVRFHVPNGLHYSLLTENLVIKMKMAGFTTLRLSLETTDDAQLAAWKRSGDTSRFRRATGWLRAAGFARKEIGVYIMAGIPGQSPDSVRRAIDDAHAAGGNPYLNEYSPIPGTAEWENALRLSGSEIESEPLWQNNSLYYTREEVFTRAIFDELKRRAKEARAGAASQSPSDCAAASAATYPEDQAH